MDALPIEPPPKTRSFYREAMLVLRAAKLPFLVGGSYVMRHYTGIARPTKDFDLFMRPRDLKRTLRTFTARGYRTELTARHWIGKIRAGNSYIDVIVRGGNGYGEVDADWFRHAESIRVLGLHALACPAEETIWSKAYVMERERFDGADVLHLLHAMGPHLDWPRLVARFGDHWRILLSYLVLFGFVYPSDRDRIPGWVIAHLVARLREDDVDTPPGPRLCRGTLLSSKQYRVDVEQWGYADGSLRPYGRLTERENAER